jgi:hypothetical protein
VVRLVSWIENVLERVVAVSDCLWGHTVNARVLGDINSLVSLVPLCLHLLEAFLSFGLRNVGEAVVVK